MDRSRLPEYGLLSRYLRELEAWNRKLNLTAMSEGELWKGLSDVRSMWDAADVRPGDSVLDVGAGGGLVGIPFAIWGKETTVVLLESIRKKSGFLLHVAGILELPVEVENRRLEELAESARHAERYAVIVSRAAVPVTDLVRAGSRLLARGGRIVAWVHDAATVADDPPEGITARVYEKSASIVVFEDAGT